MSEGEAKVAAEAGWRTDQGWSLVAWDPSYWTSKPLTVTKEAELCGDGFWASVFAERRIVATWFRERIQQS